MTVLSSTSTYALRALALLATRPSEPAVARDIAGRASIPTGYLSKILGQLARTGVLTAVRGIKGGYTLARPPDEITLAEVVSCFEEAVRSPGCVVGGGRTCPKSARCRAHDRWRLVVDAFSSFLASTTVADLASGSASVPGKGRRAVGRRGS